MSRFKWALVYVLTFVVAFVISVYLTISLPGGFGGIGDVDWNDSIGKAYIDLPYADGDLNKFDLYVPAGGPKSSDKLVLYIHAGGFTGGDKAEDAEWAHYFVSKGYVAATINYTTSTKEHPSNVHRMSLEIRQGVAAIKEEAARLGYELDAMAVAGGSAGGALAMIYAYRDAATSPIPVACVIQMVGPGSFDPADWFGFDDSYQSDEQAAAAAGFVTIMTGDTVTPAMMRNGEYKVQLAKISPRALVTKTAVPSLIGYGPYDKLVPIKTGRVLVQALRDSGVPHDYVEFSNSGHGLNRDPDKARLFVKLIDQYLQRYLALPH